jgi:hypothetical protein
MTSAGQRHIASRRVTPSLPEGEHRASSREVRQIWRDQQLGQSGVLGQSGPQGHSGQSQSNIAVPPSQSSQLPGRSSFSIVATSRQVERRKDSKRVAEAWIGEVIADASSLRGGGHEATPAQTGEVIRQVGPSGVEGVGHLAGIGGAVKERDEDAAPRGVRERETDAAKRLEVQCWCRYSHGCTRQRQL